jgi:hypothetical protein
MKILGICGSPREGQTTLRVMQACPCSKVDGGGEHDEVGLQTS